MGVTGRGIMEAMIAGEDSPEILSWKVKGKLREKEKLVKESLKGCFNEFHRLMLESYYKHYQFLTAKSLCSSSASRKGIWSLTPGRWNCLDFHSGSGADKVAWHMIAELGTDLSVFSDADHCASWAGLVPGENESAGQEEKHSVQKEGTRSPLRRVLSQAAWAASHCTRGYLRAYFYRMKSRNGWANAVIATAHKILIIAFHMLQSNKHYKGSRRRRLLRSVSTPLVPPENSPPGWRLWAIRCSSRQRRAQTPKQ